MPNEHDVLKITGFDLSHDVVGVVIETDGIEGFGIKARAVPNQINGDHSIHSGTRQQMGNDPFPTPRPMRRTMNQNKARHGRTIVYSLTTRNMII